MNGMAAYSGRRDAVPIDKFGCLEIECTVAADRAVGEKQDESGKDGFVFNR
jgi:hypothetical protein